MISHAAETDKDIGGADTEENNVSSDASVSVLLCDVRTVIHPSILGCFHGTAAHLPSRVRLTMYSKVGCYNPRSRCSPAAPAYKYDDH